MTKVLEKKNWREHLNKCYEVQEKLYSCIINNTEFKSLDYDSKEILKNATKKDFIWNYFNFWVNPGLGFPYDNLFNNDSLLWKKHQSALININRDCNLFSLYECCRDTYNLDNLKGHYEYSNRFLPTIRTIDPKETGPLRFLTK